MNLLTKYKQIWIVLIYGIFYMTAFYFLEQSNTEIHIIHTKLDVWIPFCEYFIVPYVLWYFFVIAVVIYFCFFQNGKREYYQLIGTLGTGMTIFLMISYLYPNGQDLRPVVQGNGPFIWAVRWLYQIDTSTNILPSIHVFHTTACMIALSQNEKFRKKNGALKGIGILSICIILSTMFLKQHSVVDVSFALILNVLCYYIFYWYLPSHLQFFVELWNEKKIFTIPNILSFLRLFLAFFFLAIFFRGTMEYKQQCLAGILLISGISDFLDGKIARKFQMISELGKILDSIADKVTQGALLICLMARYPLMWMLLVLFFLKEGYMIVNGIQIVERTQKNEGAKWYGKLNTAVFYAMTVILMIFPDIPLKIANGMIGISTICMMMAFVLYAYQYRKIKKGANGKRYIILENRK